MLRGHRRSARRGSIRCRGGLRRRTLGLRLAAGTGPPEAVGSPAACGRRRGGSLLATAALRCCRSVPDADAPQFHRPDRRAGSAAWWPRSDAHRPEHRTALHWRPRLCSTPDRPGLRRAVTHQGPRNSPAAGSPGRGTTMLSARAVGPIHRSRAAISPGSSRPLRRVAARWRG